MRSLERPTEVERLTGIEEFDGEHTLGVENHLVEFRTSIGSHADVVFLSLASGNAIDRTRHTERLALADDGGSSVLCDHKTTIDTWIGNEETGKTACA